MGLLPFFYQVRAVVPLSIFVNTARRPITAVTRVILLLIIIHLGFMHTTHTSRNTVGEPR